ncbi:FtsX-like permease family protein [Aeromicrobium sp. Marseille-Q0843]|uniref:FtsX-like permease family protein n=1 Tax=Aeromicrobium phoceense TaxID=2754045 RepID=A0A838X8A6_9ACTN|nr:FtsX-like permease family protein [Aeromicrobium phoceense]MBA4607739.1 FtsX-like permease family protein [Aeromicrobium phoceense]
MRTVLFASLRTHTRRYVSALVAVSIAVAFVVVIDAIGSGARSGIAASVEAAYPEADLVVGEEYGIAESDPDRVLRVAESRGDRAAVIASTWTTVEGPEGTIGDDVRVGTVALDPQLRSQEISSGRAPSSDREALVSTDTAKAEGIALGDTLTVGVGRETVDVTVVGLAGSSSYLDADVDITWPAMAAVGLAIPDAVAYDVRDDVAGAQEALTAVTESPVQTRDEYVDARIVLMNQGADVLSYLLLLFAAIAGFVAVLVIANTFTILFAQRSRDFALLRCVGATGRQVLRSVRAEALVLALVAGATGVVAGIVTGRLLGWLIRAFAGEEAFGPVSHSPTWLVAAFVGGVLTTIVAAWLPTRAVVRVSPLAALRPAADPTARTTAGRVRIAVGVLTTLAGFAALGLAVWGSSMPLMLAGGMASFIGVLLLGPVVVPRLLRLFGRVGRAGGPFRVAAANAVRHPRRSAATTASLLVGVTLATAILTGMASARDAVTTEMDAEYPVDFAVSGARAFDPDLVEAVRGVPDVADVRGVKGATVASEAGRLTVIAASEADRAATLDPAAISPKGDEVLIPAAVAQEFADGVPEELTLRTGDGAVTLATRVVGSEWGQAAIVPTEALEQVAPDAAVRVLWVLAEDGADADDLAGALGALTRDADGEVANNLKDQQWVATQLDVLVWAVLGLLGVGILIALVGIANTVGLSILERSREHALMRALGLTRRGLSRVLAAEGMLLALVASVMGVVLGTVYAMFGVATVVADVMPDARLVVPWGQLAAVLVVATAAGLAAATLPARRGARVMPAEGLTLD